MIKRAHLTDEELIEIYLAKYRSLGRPPSAEELNKDPETPSYWTYLRRLGNQSKICRDLGLPLISPKIFQLFCSDCVEEKDSCGQHPRICAQDAALYFRGPDQGGDDNGQG